MNWHTYCITRQYMQYNTRQISQKAHGYHCILKIYGPFMDQKLWAKVWSNKFRQYLGLGFKNKFGAVLEHPLMSYWTSSGTEKKPFFSLTFNLENMREKKKFSSFRQSRCLVSVVQTKQSASCEVQSSWLGHCSISSLPISLTISLPH